MSAKTVIEELFVLQHLEWLEAEANFIMIGLIEAKVICVPITTINRPTKTILFVVATSLRKLVQLKMTKRA